MDEMPSLFDDPIEKAYYEEIGNEFELTDADANFAPYPTLIQEEIRRRLDMTITAVEQYQTATTEEDTTQIIQTATELKASLHRLPKSQVFDKLKSLGAKARKFSPELGKEVIKTLFIEGLKLAWLLAAGS